MELATNASETIDTQVSFDPRLFGETAARLRGHTWDQDEVIGQYKLLDLLQWLDGMAFHCKGRLSHLAQISETGKLRALRFSAETLIQAVRFAGLLRQDSKLKQTVKLVAGLLGFEKDWLSESAVLPSAPTISRYRFHIVCLLHILIRQRLWEWIQDGVKFHTALGAVSSPRSGREWLFAEAFYHPALQASRVCQRIRRVPDHAQEVSER